MEAEFYAPKASEPAKRIVTHSQSKATTQVAQTQTDAEFCVCPDPKHTLATMDGPKGGI